MRSVVIPPAAGTPTPRRAAPSALVGARLPRTASYLAGAAAVLLAIGAKFGLGWTGWFTAFFTAALLYVVVLSAWSFTVEGRRRAKDRFASTVIHGCFIAALIPLGLILVYMLQRGVPALSNALSSDSGYGARLLNATVGSIEQVGIAALIALPMGVFTAIYLVEYGRGRFAQAVTFFVDVMTGVPSIVAGLFVYTFLLLGFGARPFGLAGALALTVLMLPVVVRSSEEMLRLVPRDLRDASYALGVPKWRTILKIVLPTALSGLITSALLAIARVAGETAPLILLVGYTSFFNGNPFASDQATLPMMVWDLLGKRAGTSQNIQGAFGAALVLILLVLLLNVVARLLAKLAQPKSK
jgi:phosphate transport system permease protein